MKATELIKRLQELVDVHGDHEVLQWDDKTIADIFYGDHSEQFLIES